ncbi:MAG: hypothetical protein QXT13_10180 [Pyrobaculum sp.]
MRKRKECIAIAYALSKLIPCRGRWRLSSMKTRTIAAELGTLFLTARAALDDRVDAILTLSAIAPLMPLMIEPRDVRTLIRRCVEYSGVLRQLADGVEVDALEVHSELCSRFGICRCKEYIQAKSIDT